MSPTSLTLQPLLKYSFYVGISMAQIVGLINFYFNYKTKKFSQDSRISKIYCGLLHFFYLAFMPFAVTSPHIEEAAYMQRTFYVAMNNLVTVLRSPAILLSLWGIWWWSKEFFEVINEFEKLRLENFHTLCETKRNVILKRNDRIVWLKLITTHSIMIMFYMRIFTFAHQPSWSFIGLSLYFGCLEAVAIFNMNSYFWGLCYVNCALRYIQAELHEFELNLDLENIHRLSKIFGKICKLSNDITTIFQWQLLAIMLAAMVSLVALFFNLIIWYSTSLATFKYPLLICALVASFVNITDKFLIAFVCSDIKQCSENIKKQLLTLSLKPELGNHKIMENNLSLFSLQISFKGVRVNLCRFLDLDMKTAFGFLNATMGYLILLVQFDLKNW